MRDLTPEARDRVMTAALREPPASPVPPAPALSETVASVRERVTRLEADLAAANRTAAKKKRMTPDELRDALARLFDTYDFSPAEELVRMVMAPGHPHYVTDDKLRASILMDLQSYVMPRLKSNEIKGRVDHDHKITIVRIGEEDIRLRAIELAQPAPLLVGEG